MLFYQTLLIAHVVVAIIGLVAGTIVLFLKKGDKLHQRIGKVFLYGMLSASFMALVLAAIKSHIFLFIVGIFTIYLIGTGARFIKLKLTNNEVRATWLDWTLSSFMLVSGILFLFYGTKLLFDQKSFGWVLVTFGLIATSGVWQDVRYYRGLKKEKMYWLATHLSRMTGGYIAAVTAFLVNNTGLFPGNVPGFVFWLVPTALLTPLMVFWQRKYAKQ